MNFEELVRLFAVAFRRLRFPEAQLSTNFAITNLVGLDDIVESVLDSGEELETVLLALAGARTLVRLERGRGARK